MALWICCYWVPRGTSYFVEFICERVCEKIEVWILCLWLVSRPPNSGTFLGKFTVELVWKSISGKNTSPWKKSPCFDFLTVFHLVSKNQECCESWLVGFWVSRHSKMYQISANNFSFSFLSCHYWFTNYFEILIFAFSNVIPKGFSTCKILLF